MIISINGANTPTPEKYEVIPKNTDSKLTNSQGDLFVYRKGDTQYTIKVGWLPLEDEELNDIMSSLSDIVVPVTFYCGGQMITRNFSYNIPTYQMMDCVNGKARWKNFEITFTQAKYGYVDN